MCLYVIHLYIRNLYVIYLYILMIHLYTYIYLYDTFIYLYLCAKQYINKYKSYFYHFYLPERLFVRLLLDCWESVASLL